MTHLPSGDGSSGGIDEPSKEHQLKASDSPS